MLPLEGRTIALPEARELDRLAELVEHDGGKTLRCPLVAIRDAPDQGPSEAWLRALVAGELDDVIFLTGEGLRRLLGTAERLGLRDAVVAALGRVRKVTRGPKPARALHEIGLSSDLAAPVPTSAGVIDALAALDLRGASGGRPALWRGAQPPPGRGAGARGGDRPPGRALHLRFSQRRSGGRRVHRCARQRKGRRGRLHQRLADRSPVPCRGRGRRRGAAEGGAGGHCGSPPSARSSSRPWARAGYTSTSSPRRASSCAAW